LEHRRQPHRHQRDPESGLRLALAAVLRLAVRWRGAAGCGCFARLAFGNRALDLARGRSLVLEPPPPPVRLVSRSLDAPGRSGADSPVSAMAQP
jgi:hypothetical protein